MHNTSKYMFDLNYETKGTFIYYQLFAKRPIKNKNTFFFKKTQSSKTTRKGFQFFTYFLTNKDNEIRKF